MNNANLLKKEDKGVPLQSLAILFTDMKGSSTFYKTHGNLAGRIMIQRLNDMLSPIAKAHKGVVVKTIGDSIMAYFLAPKDALWAAIAMQQHLATYNRDHDSDQKFLIRIAIDYGHGIIEEHDVFGDVVNTAAKLVACCEPQQILVTGSFYHETNKDSEGIFSPFVLPEKKEQLAALQAYQVHWEEIRPGETNTVYLLSLQIERTAAPRESRSELSGIIPVLKRTALEVVARDGETACAFFAEARACLKAAGRALEHYLKDTAEGEALPRVVKAGLHALPMAERDLRQAPDMFKESLEACNIAEPYEIILSVNFYNELPHEIKKDCAPVTAATGQPSAHYRYRSGKHNEQAPVFTSIVPDMHTAPESTPCFYCASNQHAAARCPSKLIRQKADYLERFGYLPLEEMRRLFHEHLADILRPLTTGSQEARFDLLLNESSQDLYALAFVSYYETSAIFQLRAIVQLFNDQKEPGVQSPHKDGTLGMGLDCLRVSRPEEAAEWFEKTTRERANDYRVHVALGLVSIERSHLEQALSHLHNALSFATLDMQRRHIYLLIARLYEVADSLPHALQNAERALAISPDWSAARYYLAVLLMKTGSASAALEIFRRLIQQAPHYYLLISLNPATNFAKKEAAAFLNRELISLRARAEKSFKSITKAIDEYGPLLKRDDEDFIVGYNLYRKASDILQRESILGLADIPGFELTVRNALERAFTHRQRYARKRLDGFRAVQQANADYLSRFPYASLISDRHAQRNKALEHQIDAVLRTLDAVPPPGLQETQALLGRLARESQRIQDHQHRLEALKQFFFTLECTLKVSGICIGTTLLSAAVFASVLMLYQIYEGSLSSLTAAKLLEFVRFGLFVGLFAGLCGMVVWFKRSFGRIHKKLES